MKAELQYSENGMLVTGIQLEAESEQEKSLLRAVNFENVFVRPNPYISTIHPSYLLDLEVTSVPTVEIPKPVPLEPV